MFVKEDLTNEDGKDIPCLPSQVKGESMVVKVSEDGWDNIRKSRSKIEAYLDTKAAVYGVTTGFGALRNVHLKDEELGELQVNLIRSHAAGCGKPLSISRVKRLMTVRINILVKGYSGVREETVERIVAMLNAHWTFFHDGRTQDRDPRGDASGKFWHS